MSTDVRPSVGPRLIHLSGTPYERGVAYGQAIGDRLASDWNTIVRNISKPPEPSLPTADLCAWLRNRAHVAVTAALDLDEEVHGIADGAGVPYEAALGIAIDIFDLTDRDDAIHAETGGDDTRRQILRNQPVAGRTHCLSIMVPGEYTTTGTNLLAETWDGTSLQTPTLECAKPIVLTVEEAQGRSIHFTQPGWLGGAGVNDRGLGSVHTGVGCDNGPVLGFAYGYLARRILQASDIDSAQDAIASVPNQGGGGSGNCHYVVGDDQEFVDVEMAGTVNATLRTRGHIFSTSATFNEERCLQQQVYQTPEPLALTRYRTARATRLAHEGIPLSPLDLIRVLSDHVEGPAGWRTGTVCLHEPGSGHGDVKIGQADETSRGVVVVDPANQTMWAKDSPPCSDGPIREIRITPDGFETRLIESVSAI